MNGEWVLNCFVDVGRVLDLDHVAVSGPAESRTPEDGEVNSVHVHLCFILLLKVLRVLKGDNTLVEPVLRLKWHHVHLALHGPYIIHTLLVHHSHSEHALLVHRHMIF